MVKIFFFNAFPHWLCSGKALDSNEFITTSDAVVSEKQAQKVKVGRLESLARKGFQAISKKLCKAGSAGFIYEISNWTRIYAD